MHESCIYSGECYLPSKSDSFTVSGTIRHYAASINSSPSRPTCPQRSGWKRTAPGKSRQPSKFDESRHSQDHLRNMKRIRLGETRSWTERRPSFSGKKGRRTTVSKCIDRIRRWCRPVSETISPVELRKGEGKLRLKSRSPPFPCFCQNELTLTMGDFFKNGWT